MLTIAQRRVGLDDPHNCTDLNDVHCILEAVFDTLVRRGPDNRFLPGLAARWSVSDDARHWRFDLHADLRFHNGEPLDAAAVCYNLERMSRPDMGVTLGAPGVYAQYLNGAVFTSVSSTQIDIELAAPMADLLDILVYGYIIAPGSEDGGRPIGSGAYLLEHVEDGIDIRARANESYFDDPLIHEFVHWRCYDTPEERLAALESGAVQIANDLPASAVATKGWTAFPYMSPTTYIYLLNCARPALQEPAVRRALNQAIDRERLVDHVLDGAGQPLVGFLSPAHFGFDPSAEIPSAATDVLAGLTLEMDSPTSLPDEAEMLSQELVRQLSDAGVSINVTYHEDRLDYAHRVRKKQIGDLCVFDSSPLSTYRVLREKIDSRWAGSWWQGYTNADVEALIDRAASTVTEESRAALFRHCYRLLQDDPPWLFLYNHRQLLGIAGNRPDWQMRPDGVLDIKSLPAIS